MVLVAAGQLTSSSSLTTNLKQAITLIQKAVNARAKVLFLPEASDYIARNALHSVKICKPVAQSRFVVGIQQKLKTLSSQGVDLHVVVGIHGPASTAGKVQNLLIYINEKGEITEKYQKIHLFDVEVPNGPILKELDSVEAGSKIVKPFNTPIGKLGLGICYDIRFPELGLKLREQGAEILTFPSAFTVKTGAAHWHLLARARAIDTQSYVILAAQSGVHDTSIEDDENGNPIKTGDAGKRISYGHTLIVDPWGTILAESGEISADLGLITADIDLAVVGKVRTDMPLLKHRRNDVFT